MRGRGSVVLIATIGALVALPVDAAANGGAYLDFDRTHYLPGDSGVARTDVRIPERRESLLDEGPFYLFLLPVDAVLEEGRPIPSGAIRLGTFTFDEGKGASYELRAAFTVPQVTSGYHEMRVCNDPCTISGFREVLTGSISVVATMREAQLLTESERLRGRVFGFRHEARRAERRLENVEGDLEARLELADSERERLSTEIARLEGQLRSARRRLAAAEAGAGFDPWLVGGILLLTAIAAVLVFRKRRLSLALLPTEPYEHPAITGNGNVGHDVSLDGQPSIVSTGPREADGKRKPRIFG